MYVAIILNFLSASIYTLYIAFFFHITSRHLLLYSPLLLISIPGGIVKATLGDAYDIFLKIRQAGVRIHGWP